MHREDAPHEPFAYAPKAHGAVDVGVSTSVASTVALLERALAVLLPLLSPLPSRLSPLASLLSPLASLLHTLPPQRPSPPLLKPLFSLYSASIKPVLSLY